MVAFFRPSFGRRGGQNRSEFGEFDFIILADHCIYLGESKWDGSSEKIVDSKLELREEQLFRHELLKFYIIEWLSGNYSNWQNFKVAAEIKIRQRKFAKPIAPINSTLAKNLQSILELIRKRYHNRPNIKNVLLFFHKNLSTDQLPQYAGDDFDVVLVDYSKDLTGNYIEM